MEQNDEDPPPFWLRQINQHQQRHQRRVSSMFLNTGVLVIVLMVTAVIFLSIVIPSVVSLSRQLFNPGLVKRSWSSLNVLLVIFAIVCGFLSRKDDDSTPVNTPTRKDDENLEKMQYNNFGDLECVLRLRRNSSSYPDLRQESNWAINDNKWRFNDDTHVDNHQFQRLDSQVVSTNQVEGTKDIEVAYESRTPPSPPPPPTSYFWPSPPPPPPPSPPRRGHSSTPSKKKTIQTFETIGHGRYKWKNNSGVRQPKPKKVAPPPPPPPPPPPRLRSRPVPMGHYTENNDFFSSFYYQSKKGKHKRRSYENLENLVEPPKTTTSIYRSKSTPEFPPPPPQPPPPPPPSQSAFNHLFYSKPKPQKKVKPTKVNPPPPPTPKKPVNKILSFTTMDDDKFGGGDESPMRTIPPPPPPPPFKMKPWRFVKQGDYVKIIDSNKNNNNNTPPCNNYSTSEDESSKPVQLFSPSPDVNIKAEDFIAKFRAKLNLEKSNSTNLRHDGIVPSRLRDYSY